MSHCNCASCRARAKTHEAQHFTADQAIAELERLIREHAAMVQALKRMLDSDGWLGRPDSYWDSWRHARDVLEQVEGRQ